MQEYCNSTETHSLPHNKTRTLLGQELDKFCARRRGLLTEKHLPGCLQRLYMTSGVAFHQVQQFLVGQALSQYLYALAEELWDNAGVAEEL